MKYLVLFLLCFFTSEAFAFDVPKADSFLVDQAGVLSSQQSSNLKSRLNKIDSETNKQIVILILSSLDGESIEDVAYQTFNAWGVGKKESDNGVLILVSINDHKMRIETGKGIGGELTDLQTQDILNKKLAPAFKESRYYDGLNDGLDSLTETSSKESKKSEGNKESNSNMFWILLGIFLVYILIAFLCRDPFWGIELLFVIFSSSRSNGSSDGDSFGGGSSGGGGSSSSW